MNLRIYLVLMLFTLPVAIWAQHPWEITAEKITADNYYGITVANGMVGIVSSPQPLQVKEVVLAGVYDQYARGRVSNFLPSYNLLNMKLAINGAGITMANIANYTQKLDMRKGEFVGSFDYKDVANVTYSYTALRHLPHTVMMEVTVKMKTSGTIVVDNLLETPSALRDQQNYFNEIEKAHVYIPLLTSVAKSPTGSTTIAASNTFLFNESKENQPNIIHKMNDTHIHTAKFAKQLASGQEYSFALIGTLISSVHTPDPYNQAERSTIFASLEGVKRLKEKHYKEWQKLWQSDIEIEGDLQAQQDIRSMLYHLYAFSREDSGYSVSPMGLSGLGYNGHVFWDTEIWMYPPMLLLHPEVAKSMIDYRFDRLQQAKKNASIYGYKGAMFPWESAHSGMEETPVWALTGPFEHHITACVGIAAWNYYLVTQDKQWLKEKGWPLLKETANFWQSRVEANDKGEYEIKNVVAADEWAENVDNNAFTNAAASKNLLAASKCAAELGLQPNAEWQKIAANLVLKKMPNGVTREHDSYTDQQIKQADVNLLAYPLKVIRDKEQIKRDLAFYETKVPQKGTPAMTQAIFSLLYSHLGDGEKAYHWFSDAYQKNLNPPFRVIAEFKGGTNPYFATGAGGLLQAVIMGFGGVNIKDDGGIEQIKTALPPHWKSVVIKGVGINKRTYKVAK